VTTDLRVFARHDKRDLPDWRRADDLAQQLKTHIDKPEVAQLLAAANSPGSSSALVQAAFVDFATKLGFKSECTGLFDGYANSSLRPDYYLPLRESGVLLEVERGKTTINNMDLLDFWKCHLCEGANYLFLLVPRELRQNAKMSPRREFNAVAKRMASFFEPRNYTNVYGLWLFGY
jgi:hypothetical protein